jgi:hypothetical protein
MNNATDTTLSLPHSVLGPDIGPEWDIISRNHHNVLFEGSRNATAAAVAALLPSLAEPIALSRPGEALDLEAGRCRMLIVPDVGALKADEQTRPREWLGDHASNTPQPRYRRRSSRARHHDARHG